MTLPKPYYQDEWVTQYCDDALRVLPELSSESIDLLATDPPYGISFMGKDWDTFNEIVNPQGAYEHKKGFKKLPRQSTKSLPEFFIPIWKECLRILKPGAFAFVMCSPRQDVLSRQILNLQDAGFNVGFTSIYWAYASGFPKAQNISKAVDKRLGAEREVISVGKSGKPNTHKSSYQMAIQDNNTFGGEFDITKASSPQAKALDGSYGGFQPKPAVEVIIVAMKPLSEKTYVDQALKNKKGITWLDDGRITYVQNEEVIPFQYKHSPEGYGYRDRPRGGYGGMKIGIGKPSEHQEYDGEREPNPTGRFPANVLVSDGVLNDGRVTKSSGGKSGHTGAYSGGWKEEYYGKMKPGLSDVGSFSRYFDLDKWFEERIKQLPASVQKTFPFLIVSKASKSEKNKGLDYEPQPIVGRDEGQDVRNVPQKARSTPRINQHPTVKPLKLMSYLVMLGSREGDTVLDPFGGSGTTALACQMLNRKCIGIEIEEKYCEIAKKRLSQSVMRLEV